MTLQALFQVVSGASWDDSAKSASLNVRPVSACFAYLLPVSRDGLGFRGHELLASAVSDSGMSRRAAELMQ